MKSVYATGAYPFPDKCRRKALRCTPPPRPCIVADADNFKYGVTMRELNRRNFLKVAGTATAGTMLGANTHLLAAVQNEAAANRPALQPQGPGSALRSGRDDSTQDD